MFIFESTGPKCNHKDENGDMILFRSYDNIIYCPHCGSTFESIDKAKLDSSVAELLNMFDESKHTTLNIDYGMYNNPLAFNTFNYPIIPISPSLLRLGKFLREGL